MINGQHVGLRAVERSDLQNLKCWRNLPEFRKNFRESKELSSTDQDNWYQWLQDNHRNNFMFTIVDMQTNNPIGAAGLLYINWVIRSADFSFYIGHKKAYVDKSDSCIEAISLLLKYGFGQLNLNKIWMEVYEYDKKKIEVFTKNFDFSIDGKLRNNCFHSGKYYDSYVISILEAEYKG